MGNQTSVRDVSIGGALAMLAVWLLSFTVLTLPHLSRLVARLLLP